MGGREGTGAISPMAATVFGAAICVLADARTVAWAQDAALFELGSRFGMRELLIAGVITGLIGFSISSAILFMAATRRARAARKAAIAETDSLRQSHATLQEILSADPHISVYWDREGEPRVLCDALPAHLNIPREAHVLLRLASWLDLDPASELGARIEALRHRGESFNVMLRTRYGDHIEADGRAAGGTPVLKLRDLAGNRLELARILDHNLSLQTEIARHRALLEALPFPAWIASHDGVLDWVNTAYVLKSGSRDGKSAVSRGVALPGLDAVAISAEAAAQGAKIQRRVPANPRIEGGEAIAAPAPAGGVGGALLPPPQSGPIHEPRGDGDARIGTLDRIVTPVAVFDADQRLSYANPAFAALWQLDATWLKERPREGELLDRLRQLRRLPEETDYQAWKSRRLQAYGTRGVKEEWWHLPDGRTLHIVGETRPDGGVSYLYENLTEKLALESRLNALIRVQRETLDNLREGVAVFGPDGRLKLFNSALASIWRLEEEQLSEAPHIDEVIEAARVSHPEQEAWREIKHAVTAIGAERLAFQRQMDRPDGSVIACAGLPLPDGGTLITFVDITHEKRVERALVERNEALEAADRLKTSFISHMSCELRTPLTSIIGFADLLAGQHFGKLNAKQAEYLEDIRMSGAALHAIINDVLDLATIDAGAFELKIGEADAASLTRAAVREMRDSLAKRRIRIDVMIAPDSGIFSADSRRVSQVLHNLLSNAISFSEDGSRVTLSCAEEGDMMSFTIADEGCGISEDYQSAIFESFEGRSLGERRRGAGLGLTMVKHIVDMHGGEIRLQSAPGAGTEVKVLFPIAQPDARAPAGAGSAFAAGAA